MTYDRILSHKLYKSNYFKSTLQKCLQQEGVAGLGEVKHFHDVLTHGGKETRDEGEEIDIIIRHYYRRCFV